jgi:hypothetical protein
MSSGEHVDDGATPSLSQLIYSSQLSAFHPGNNAKVVAVASRKVKEEESIDAFYGLQTQSGGSAAAATSSSSPAGRMAKRMTRRSRAKRNRDVDEYLESQSQADERERKKSIQRQLEATKNRWKARKVDWRNEIDDGGVFETFVRNHWTKKRKNQTKENVENPLETFWEQGLSVPRAVPGVPNPGQVPIHRRPDLPPEPKLNHPFPFYKPPNETIEETKHMVHRQHLLNCPVSGVHFHQGTVAKIAARCLIAGNCTMDEQDQFLKILYKTNPNLRSEAVLTDAAEHGLNFQAFQQYLWQDRAKAAELLLFTNTGKRRSTQRKVVYAHEKARRRTVIAKLSTSKKDSARQAAEENEMNSMNVSHDEEETRYREEFRYEKGSVPPTPEQPMDVTNIVFGAEDAYSQSVCIGRVKPETAELTLSILVSRVAAATDGEEALKAHAQVMSFLDFLLRENKLYVRGLINKYNRGVELNVPAVAEYHAWMQYCRYVPNHNVASVASVASGTGDMVKIEADEDEEASDKSSIRHANVVAEEMSLVLEETQTRHGLKSFPRLHLIYAVCLITRELPPQAANIFARGDHKTPLHAMKQTLEFLEVNGMLKEQPNDVVPFRTIMVAHFEHILHEAATVIETRCISVSNEIDYVAWLAALRLSILLLCSGLKIGGPAFPYPSYKSKRVNVDSYFSQDSALDRLPHEARLRLPKYEAKRLQAAQASRNLLQRASNPGGRANGMVLAALEWSQTIALMLGTGKEKSMKTADQPWRQIRILYSQYALQASSLNLSQLREMQLRYSINIDDVLGRLASNLELDPSNLNHWRCLIQELGPLGGAEKPCSCCECQCLRGNIFVDHSKREERHWWGRERLSWWEAHLLNLPLSTRIKPTFIFDVGQRLEQWLQDQVLPSCTNRLSATDIPATTNHAWLDSIIDSIKKEQGNEESSALKHSRTPPIESRRVAVDDLLPQSITTETDKTLAPCIPNLNDENLEVLSYKTFLSAHLYGADNSAVARGVVFLASQSTELVDNKNQEGAWQCLLWLTSHGLHTSRILMSYYESMYPVNEKDGSSYSEEAKEAMRLGIQCFGTKSFSLIRDNVPFFGSWEFEKVMSLHRAMTTHGEL